MVGKKSTTAAKLEQQLQAQTAKALRRGEKLTRALTRIVAQIAPDGSHPAQILLLALKKGLPKLREQGEADGRPNGSKKTKTPKKTVEAEATPAAGRKSSPKANAPRATRTQRVQKPAVDLKTKGTSAA